MFPEVEPRGTLRFEGNKINCFPRDQSLSNLLYSKTRDRILFVCSIVVVLLFFKTGPSGNS